MNKMVNACMRIIILAIIIAFAMFFWSYIFMKNLNIYGYDHSFFYEQEKDSVEVLFVGPSHCYCGFIPKELEDKYGLGSYNLSAPNQSVLASYLWAKEAYEYQKYTTLVLELATVSVEENDFNTDLRALYSMSPSPRYYEMIKYHPRWTPKIIFPLLVLHNEWENISLSSFTMSNRITESDKGYVKLDSKAGEEYTVSVLEGNIEAYGDLPLRYVDMIRMFCEENHINLILVKTIVADGSVNRWDDACHNRIQEYCQQYNLDFIDFNAEEYMSAAGLSISEDVAEDLRHANYSGAKKMTEYIGRYIEQKIQREKNMYE